MYSLACRFKPNSALAHSWCTHIRCACHFKDPACKPSVRERYCACQKQRRAIYSAHHPAIKLFGTSQLLQWFIIPVPFFFYFMRHLCSFVDLITSCICSPTHFLARLFNWAMDSHVQGWQNVMLTVYFRSILFVVFIAECLLIIFRNFELGSLWTVFLISLTINRQYFGAGNDSISVWRTVWKMAQTSILVGSVGSYFSSRNSYFFSSNSLVKLYHIYNFWRLQWWWECFQVRSLNL